MPFGTITAADIEAHLSAGELHDFRRHSSQIEDPLPTIIADAIDTVRGHLAVRYDLTESGIPSELRSATIDIIIDRLVRRIRGEADDARTKAAERAQQLCRDAAEGKFGIFATRPVGEWGSGDKFNAI